MRARLLVAATIFVGLRTACVAAATPPTADNVEAQLGSALNVAAVVAGVATDHISEVRPHPWPESARSVQIESVLWGDPDARTILVRTNDADLKPGDRVIVIYRGQNYSPCNTVLADTPERRAAIRALIEKTEREQFAPEFLDREAMFRAGESLLREFLQRVAERFPEHPYLGREAMKRIRIVRSDAPPGAYVRIAGNAAWYGPAYERVLLPQGGGALLWVGLGLERHRPYRLGHPQYLVDPSEVATVEPKPDPPDVTARPVEQAIGDGPIWLKFYGAMPSHDHKNTDIEALLSVLRSIEPKARALSRDPPRDLDTAIAFLETYHAGLTAKPPPSPALSIIGPPDPRLAQAFQALGCPTSYVGPAPGERNLSDGQRARLVPVLIDLLLDRHIVVNQTPGDGPMVACHQMAYLLLVRVTGQRLPEPLSEAPEWARGFVYDPLHPPGPPPDPAKARAQTTERLNAWRDWWNSEGRKGLKP